MCRHHDDRRPRQRGRCMDLRDGHQPSCALGAEHQEAPNGLFVRSRSSPDLYRGSLAASIRDDYASRCTHPRALRSQWSAAALGVRRHGLGCRPAFQDDPWLQPSDDDGDPEAEGTFVSSRTRNQTGSKPGSLDEGVASFVNARLALLGVIRGERAGLHRDKRLAGMRVPPAGRVRPELEGRNDRARSRRGRRTRRRRPSHPRRPPWIPPSPSPRLRARRLPASSTPR